MCEEEDLASAAGQVFVQRAARRGCGRRVFGLRGGGAVVAAVGVFGRGRQACRSRHSVGVDRYKELREHSCHRSDSMPLPQHGFGNTNHITRL